LLTHVAFVLHATLHSLSCHYPFWFHFARKNSNLLLKTGMSGKHHMRHPQQLNASYLPVRHGIQML